MTALRFGMVDICILVLLISIIGCASVEKKIDEYGSSRISRPISEVKQAMKSPDSYASKIDWDETTYPLSNGYYIFVEPFSNDCYIQWKVSPRDTIVGYYAKGKGCGTVRESGPAASEIEKFSPPAKWN